MLLAFFEATWGLFAALTFFAVSAFYWSRTAGKEAAEQEIASRSRSALTNLFFRRWFYWVLGPIERFLIKSEVHPETLNWAGLFLNALAGVNLAQGSPGAAALFIALGGGCDLLDGRIARKRGMASKRGAFIDSTLDRYSDAAVYAGLLWLFAGDRVLSLIVFSAALGAMLVSYARARGEALGVQDAPAFAQRPERILLLVLACMLSPLESAIFGLWGLPPRHYILSGTLFFLAAASHLAAAERFSHAIGALDIRGGPPAA